MPEIIMKALEFELKGDLNKLLEVIHKENKITLVINDTLIYRGIINGIEYEISGKYVKTKRLSIVLEGGE